MVAFSDLIVIVPGILGSRLRRPKAHGGTQVIWDLSIRHLPGLFKAAVTGDLAVRDDDDVVADELFSYQLLPGLFGVDDYDTLVAFLRGMTTPEQVVTHPYDWRLSNRVAAEALERKVGDGLARLRRDGANDPKARIIAHSMGGLVARYYCEALGGAKHTRGIIYVGTPHRGSVNALDGLVNGKKFGPLHLSSALRSMPSLYELLPLFPVLRTGHENTHRLARIAESFGLDPKSGDDLPMPDNAENASAHLPHLDRSMLQDALRFHHAIREPVENREASETPYVQHVIFNRRQHTMHSAALDGERLQLFRSYPVNEAGKWREEDARGDGTVPAQAAVPIEWDDTAQGVTNAQKHAGIPATKEAQEAIRNWLWPLDARGFRGDVPDDQVIVLDVPAVVEPGLPLTVTVSSTRDAFVTIEVIDPSTGQPRISQPAPVTEEPFTMTFGALPAGVYRVVATTKGGTHPPVTDYAYIEDPGN
jgi:pimeloyl-ACP methyl ester carboxylesterase